MVTAKDRRIVTITGAQMSCLKWATQMAEDWRGNCHPDEWEEFDGGIKGVREAIKQVKADRKRLRQLEAALLELTQ